MSEALRAVTRSTLYALVLELGHLSGKQVASLIGLAPFNDDSGTRERRRRIRGGRADVREVLYMAAMSARLHDATFVRSATASFQQERSTTSPLSPACARSSSS
jgi:transposase